MIYLHRWIMNPDEGKFIDHQNHDTLNNTRQNLREATVSENSLNRRRKQKGNRNSATGVKGIYIQHGKFAVTATEDGIKKYIGRFDSLEQAKECLDNHNIKKRVI